LKRSFSKGLHPSRDGAVAKLQVELPDELMEVAGQDKAFLERLAREALLVRLYELGHISSGWAAGALGCSRRGFLDLLGRYGVSLFDEEMDPEAEVTRILQAAGESPP
jgi:predicted HTH domain antitoxin